jgi:hypothetical protein
LVIRAIKTDYALTITAIFDEEILLRLFSDRRPQDEKRFITGSNWGSAPQRLRCKYMRFRLIYYDVEPNLFGQLFLPVFEYWLAEKGITEHDDKDAVMNQLLRISMHDQEFGWVVAHKSHKLQTVTTLMFRKLLDVELGKAGIAYPHQLGQNQALEDYDFAFICDAILRADYTAALSNYLQEREPDLSRFSFAFGTTILKFAISRGTLQDLKYLFRVHRKPLSDSDHHYDLLHLATYSSKSPNETIAFVLQQSMAIKDRKKQKKSLDVFFKDSSRDGNLLILDAVITWLDANGDAASKESFLSRMLPIAIQAGHIHILDRFCQLIDIGKWPYSYEELLERAVYSRKPDIALLHLLMKHGANFTQPSTGRSPIFDAAALGYLDWVEELLKAGADPRSKNCAPLCELFSADVHGEVSMLLEEYGWDSWHREDLEDGFYYKGPIRLWFIDGGIPE